MNSTPSALFLHLDQRMLRAKKRTLKVEADDTIPLFLGRVRDCFLDLDGRITHQNIELAEFGDCRVNHSACIGFASGISLLEDCLGARIPYALSNSLSKIAQYISDYHLCTLVAEQLGGRFSQSICTACDDGNFAI